MARTTVTTSAAPGAYPTAGVVVTETAADTSNQNKCVFTGRELILARNSGASSRTVTITAASDTTGRSGTISAETIAAGAIRMYGPFTNAVGWFQEGGYLYFEANNAEVKFSVIVLPATL